MVYVSTDCPDDLSLEDSPLVRFERPSAEKLSPCPPGFPPDRTWFVASASGCSCTFRHLHRDSVALGFGEPEEWCPEEAEPIDATKRLYEILKGLVERGHQVEILDCWNGSGSEQVTPVPLDVSLSQVPAGHFRLFEGHLFTLKR